MARGRMISKSLSTSAKFAQLLERGGKLAEFCQSLYPLLVAHADDFGRLQGDTFSVKHVCHPASRRSLLEFDAALNVLWTVGLIARYTVAGTTAIQIGDFETHQSGIHKRTASRFPEPPGNSGTFREIPSELNLTELNRTEGKGTEQKAPGTSGADALRASFEVFWLKYPKKVGKDEARKAWQHKHPDLASALGALASQAEWLVRDGGKYTPNPSTWINQGRWQDEPPKPSAVSSQTQQNLVNRDRVMDRLAERKA